MAKNVMVAGEFLRDPWIKGRIFKIAHEQEVRVTKADSQILSGHVYLEDIVSRYPVGTPSIFKVFFGASGSIFKTHSDFMRTVFDLRLDGFQ